MSTFVIIFILIAWIPTVQSEVLSSGVEKVAMLLSDSLLSEHETHVVRLTQLGDDDAGLASALRWHHSDGVPGFRAFSDSEEDDDDDDEGGEGHFLTPCLQENSTDCLSSALELGRRSVLLLVHNQDNLELLERSSQVRFDSLIYLVKMTGDALEVYEAYSLQGGPGELVTSLVEEWRGEIRVRESKHVWARRDDFGGIPLKTLVAHNPPFTFIDPGTGEIQGFNYDLMGALSQRLNFTPDFHIRPLEELSLTSLPTLQAGLAELSLSLYYITHERQKFMDFSFPVYVVNQMLVVKAELQTLVGGSGDDIVSVFRQDVWAVWLSSAAATLLLGSLAAVSHGLNAPSEALSLYGVMVGQGSALEARQVSRRVLLLTALLFGVLCLTSLSARLISILSVREKASAVRSLQDVKDLELDLYSIGGGFMQMAFRDAHPGSAAKYLYDNKWVELPGNLDEYTVIESFLASERPSALIIHPLVLNTYTLLNKEKGCMLLGRKLKGQIQVGVPFRKNSPYVQSFNYQLVKARESGVWDYIFSEWNEEKTKEREQTCSQAADDQLWSVDFRGTAAFFVVLVCGAGFSCATAVLEKMWGGHQIVTNEKSYRSQEEEKSRKEELMMTLREQWRIIGEKIRVLEAELTVQEL